MVFGVATLMKMPVEVVIVILQMIVSKTAMIYGVVTQNLIIVIFVIMIQIMTVQEIVTMCGVGMQF